MSILMPDEISMEDPLCDSSFGSMVTLDYVTPDTGWVTSRSHSSATKAKRRFDVQSGLRESKVYGKTLPRRALPSVIVDTEKVLREMGPVQNARGPEASNAHTGRKGGRPKVRSGRGIGLPENLKTISDRLKTMVKRSIEQ